VADRREFGEAASAALRAVLATEMSPELVPSDRATPGQRAEDVVGPFSLQDFNLFCVTRYGFRPSKVAYLSWTAWRDAASGAWPAGFRGADKRAYDLPTHPPLAAHLPLPLLPDQPIQALRHAERPQSGLTRLPLPPRRLARPKRFARRRLARRAGGECAGSWVAPFCAAVVLRYLGRARMA
jgi:hypothetical protein